MCSFQEQALWGRNKNVCILISSKCYMFTDTYHSHKMERLNLESQWPHAVFVGLDQGCAVFLSFFNDAGYLEREEKYKSSLAKRQIFQSLKTITYQASLTFLVSGQAQHGFRGFFCSVASAVAAAATVVDSTPTAHTVDMFLLNG